MEFESFRARKADRNLAVETRVLSTDAEAIPLVKFIYLVFTRILGAVSYTHLTLPTKVNV